MPTFLELLKVYESGKNNLIDFFDREHFSWLVDYFNCLDDAIRYPDDYSEDFLHKCSTYAESFIKAYYLFKKIYIEWDSKYF